MQDLWVFHCGLAYSGLALSLSNVKEDPHLPLYSMNLLYKPSNGLSG